MVLDPHRLPPTARDFEVYELVHVDGMSTRQAAGRMKLSQSRVCQILTKVAQYMTQTLPGVEQADGPEMAQKMLRTATLVAAARVDHLYGLALRSFEGSQGTHVVCRAVEAGGRDGGAITTTRQSQGDCRYLLAAARLAMLGSKLPPSWLKYSWFPIAEDEPDDAEAPPMEDYSLAAVSSAETSAEPTPTKRVTLFAAEDCDTVPSEPAAAKVRLLPTVHPEESPAEGRGAVASQRGQQPLSRQERKARQRLLQRKLKR